MSVDDQGISDTPKGTPRRASPTARANPSRVLVPVPNNKKDVRKVRLFCWWTIRDSNPGPID